MNPASSAGNAKRAGSDAPPRPLRWTMVTMYTDDFADRVNVLETSARALGVEVLAERIRADEYRRTIASKPDFMLRMLERLRRPIVYIDADFEVVEYPALFDNPGGADLMIYNWYADPDNSVGRYLPDVLLCSSGVIYWNWTPGARRLLREWRTMARLNHACADDQILDRVFNEGRYISRLDCRWLPSSYLRIAPYFPDVDPVLNHADAPGTNGPAGADIRTAVRPLHWRLARRLRAWTARGARFIMRHVRIGT